MAFDKVYGLSQSKLKYSVALVGHIYCKTTFVCFQIKVKKIVEFANGFEKSEGGG